MNSLTPRSPASRGENTPKHTGSESAIVQKSAVLAVALDGVFLACFDLP